MKRSIYSIAILFVIFVCFFFVFSSTEIVQAKSYPTTTVTIDKNPITRHMYFAPSFPACTYATIAKLKFVNNTNSRATIQTDTGGIISIPPHATKYAYYYGYNGSNGTIIWQMLESNIYGGNAQLVLNSCWS